MKVKSIAAVIVIMGLLLVPCVSGCFIPVSGSGDLVTEEFSFTDFNRVHVGSTFEVEISQSDTFSISITADDNIMEYIIVNLSGDSLQVRLKQGYNYHSITAIAKIGMPDIERLELSGATEGILNDFVTSNDVTLNVSGASNLTLSALSSGDVRMEISGASRVSGNLVAGDVNFEVSGASNLSLTGSGQALKAEVSGASRISLDNFTTDNADIDLSGASTGVVNTGGTLDAEVSGASTLYYIGNPLMGDIDISGASSVQKK
jgi:hypothetical protein